MKNEQSGNWWAKGQPDKKKTKEKRVPCPKCGAPVAKKHINLHMRHGICKDNLKDQQLLRDGYAKFKMVPGTRWLNRAKKAGIEIIELRKYPASPPQRWLKKWVEIAIQTIRLSKTTCTPESMDIILEAINKNEVVQDLIVKLSYDRMVLGYKRAVAPLAIVLLQGDTEPLFQRMIVKTVQRDNIRIFTFAKWVKQIRETIEQDKVVFTREELEELYKISDRLVMFVQSVAATQQDNRNFKARTYGPWLDREHEKLTEQIDIKLAKLCTKV
jgi:hypothetical protein